MNWKRGKTLMIPTTNRWTVKETEKNDIVEETMIFSNFHGFDSGRNRRLVCTVNKDHEDYEKNAKLIESAPELYSTLKEIYNITAGPFDDPVIQEELYNKIEKLIKQLS